MRSRRRLHRCLPCFCGGLAAAFAFALTWGLSASVAHAAPPMQRITHGLPALVAESRSLGAVPAAERIPLSLVLPLRNEAALDALLTSLYTPADPAYGHYLTPAQFTAQFGPSQADYNAVVAWAKAQGLTVTETYSSRKIVRVEGPARVVGQAFGVQFRRYQAPDGFIFRAPTSEARVPVSIAARLAAVLGLDTSARIRPHVVRRPANPLLPGAFPLDDGATPQGGTGPGGIHIEPLGGGTLTGPKGGLSPLGIQIAYDLTDPTTGDNLTGQTGTGQTLGLFELDGYLPGDITTYENQFGITPVTLQNVLIDGFKGLPTNTIANGSLEVTLDIELMTALASGVNKILVYEGNFNQTTASIIDVYQRIADDNLANVVSTSWGEAEDTLPGDANFFATEHNIFKQMAAQGQSTFASSGDDGSEDWPYPNNPSNPANPSTPLNVNDPASQPYMTGVGGTRLATNASTGVYTTESVWNSGKGNAGGGGISVLWTLPSWQQNIFDAGVVSNGSTTMRNVPDVSLNAAPGPGYAICYKGSWAQIGGGTSCAAPLWAAFTALVNQARVADNCPVLGFANPPIYYLATYNPTTNTATGANYTYDFHDITSGNNNVSNDPLHYPAVKGYDDASGWGSFNGAHLLGDLTSMANSGAINQLIGNGGFEQTSLDIAPWTSTPNVVAHVSGHPAHSGRWAAWLCGYAAVHTDTLAQTVRIPSLATAATLSFWLHIETQETTTTQQNATMQVQVRDTAGNVLATLLNFSNLDHNTGYTLETLALTSLANYAGKTVQLYFTATQNDSLRTSFAVDDVTLAITE